MIRIAFFDTKPYDIRSFDRFKDDEYYIRFFESKLTPDTVSLAAGFDGVCAFVNDRLDKEVIDKLYELKVKVIAMRCAGYNNVDLKEAKDKITVMTVPYYSPYAIAEHAMGLVLTLNRKLHRAYIRTRDHNFSLEGLCGFDLYNKTVGIIGTGNIGSKFADICKGFNMRVLGFDPKENKEFCGEYCDFDTLLKESDIISLHCPLNEKNRHIIDKKAVKKMKKGVYIINTSRGALIDTWALIDGIKSGQIGASGLDVYEEETELFFEDKSDEIIHDDRFLTLISMPNVIITSHQAFLTNEALDEIAKTTLNNIKSFFEGKKTETEVVAK